MVKQQKKSNKKRHNGKGFKENGAEARKINASTVYETCTEQLSPFGGLLALIKFLDLVRFKEIFDSTYLAPRREPKLGHHLMVVGILMLLFIGFNRLWHFTYIRLDAMLCGFFRLTKLPVAGRQHVLALYGQPWHQPGQITAKSDEHFARARLATMRLYLLPHSCQHRYHR